MKRRRTRWRTNEKRFYVFRFGATVRPSLDSFSHLFSFTRTVSASLFQRIWFTNCANSLGTRQTKHIWWKREREQGMAREKPTATKKNSLLWCFCCVSTLCESKTGGKFISFSITNLIICESEIETERMRVVSDEPKILVILFLVPFFVKLNNKAATQATTTKMTTNY